MSIQDCSAKNLLVKVVTPKTGNSFIQANHYSGKTCKNSSVHFGVYLNNNLEGAMQFGPSLDKRKLIGLVRDTRWNEFIELNRLAFSDNLPKNSESRALSVVFRMFKKEWPHLKWIVSFADATQCGDGTIYRASGFVLTGIKKSENLARMKNGLVIHKMTLESSPLQKRVFFGDRSYFDVTGGAYDFKGVCKKFGFDILPGFQLRYIYLMKPELKNQLTVPIIPFDKIAEVGATMYKGNRAREA